MTDERLCALLQAALALDAGGDWFFNKGDVKEAAGMGLVEFLEPRYIQLTQAGRDRLISTPR